MEINSTTILILIAGIVIGWILTTIISYFKILSLKKEISKDKEHLSRHIKITGENTKSLEDEVKELKEKNANLSLSVKTLSQKSGNAEIKVLNIYDNAIRKMIIQAPGFSTTWELMLQESEKEYEENEKGIKSIVNKVFRSKNPSYSDTTTKLLKEK